MLTPYLAYLEKRYQQGCRKAQQLWRELNQQGYPGSDSQPTKWLSRRQAEEISLVEKQNVIGDSLPNQPTVGERKPPLELPSTQQVAYAQLPFWQKRINTF